MRVLKAFSPRPEHRPRVERAPRSRDAALRIRWLGTAGHVIDTGDTTVLLDPFLSRPGLLRTATRPLHPATGCFGQWLPPRVDAILVGHSHYDHLLDAPEIARSTGALLVGSRTTACFARAAGVPEGQIVEVAPEGATLTVGSARIRFVPSLHARLLAGRVPFPGELSAPPTLPARVHRYRMGGAFGLLVQARGMTVYHNGSADLVDAELDGVRADVVLVGIAGRQATPGYLPRLLSLLQPKLILPTHHDFFFAPLSEGVRLLPGVDLPAFLSEARALAPEARLITPLYEDVVHVPDDDARAAVVSGR